MERPRPFRSLFFGVVTRKQLASAASKATLNNLREIPDYLTRRLRFVWWTATWHVRWFTIGYLNIHFLQDVSDLLDRNLRKGELDKRVKYRPYALWKMMYMVMISRCCIRRVFRRNRPHGTSPWDEVNEEGCMLYKSHWHVWGYSQYLAVKTPSTLRNHYLLFIIPLLFLCSSQPCQQNQISPSF